MLYNIHTPNARLLLSELSSGPGREVRRAAACVQLTYKDHGPAAAIFFASGAEAKYVDRGKNLRGSNNSNNGNIVIVNSHNNIVI